MSVFLTHWIAWAGSLWTLPPLRPWPGWLLLAQKWWKEGVFLQRFIRIKHSAYNGISGRPQNSGWLHLIRKFRTFGESVSLSSVLCSLSLRPFTWAHAISSIKQVGSRQSVLTGACNPEFGCKNNSCNLQIGASSARPCVKTGLKSSRLQLENVRERFSEIWKSWNCVWYNDRMIYCFWCDQVMPKF